MTWLARKAEVEPEVGGKYELFWDESDPENNSTIGCKLLALENPHYVNFEWKGPKKYKSVINTARPLTNVTVVFSALGLTTQVTLIHTGWRDSCDWEEARRFFGLAWSGALEKLETYVNHNKRIN